MHGGARVDAPDRHSAPVQRDWKLVGMDHSVISGSEGDGGRRPYPRDHPASL